jgi:polyhydroxyalkanoate synthesis regulator phasin
MKELVDYLCKEGHPEALAFREFVESIKRQCRQAKVRSEEVLLNPEIIEESTDE